MERIEWGQRRYPERRSPEYEARASLNWVSGPWRKYASWTEEGIQSRKKHGTHTLGKRWKTRRRRGGKKKKTRTLGQGIYNLSDVQLYKCKRKNMGTLNPKEAEYLVSNSTKTPVIYYTPKIHKRLEKPPGRPIISENYK